MAGGAGARALALAAVGLMVACGGDDRTRLDVRTGLPEALREEVESSFESAHPDVDVRFSVDGAPEILEELGSSEADVDVWWGAPALSLEQAAARGLLEPYDPVWAQVDSEAPSTDAMAWHPILSTPLVLAFDRTAVTLSDAPTDWIDVFHHAWYDDVRTLDPSRTDAGSWLAGSMIVEALRDDDDLNRGFDWLARLHDQVDVYATEPEEMVRALQRDAALLAIIPRADAERARTAHAPWLHYRIPASGTPELLRGVAVVAGTDVPHAARAFVDHLGTDAVATASKLHTHWEPRAGEIDAERLPDDFELEQGSWTPYVPALDTLSAELADWIDRWELEVASR